MDEKKIEEVMALVELHAGAKVNASRTISFFQRFDADRLTEKAKDEVKTKLRQLLGEQHG